MPDNAVQLTVSAADTELLTRNYPLASHPKWRVGVMESKLIQLSTKLECANIGLYFWLWVGFESRKLWRYLL